MIYFSHLPLEKEILEALEQLKINYVFQSIFEADGKTIFAREALMRPEEMTVTELIDNYMKEDKLHVLEVATFFGAMQEYQMRSYTEKISLNSFPSESFTLAEQKAFIDYFGDMRGKGIVEILETPYISEEACSNKKKAIFRENLMLAVDNFGTGLNSDKSVIKRYNPKIIKLDRELISGIDKDPAKQEHVKSLVLDFHKLDILVGVEGVETKEEFNYLVGLGVDLFQGYYLERPA